MAFPMMGLRSMDPHDAMELMLLANPAVNQARVLELAAGGQNAQWVVAVAFTESVYEEQSESSELVNGLKDNLTRTIQSIYENITIPTKWFLVKDFPMGKDDSIDDEELRRLVIREGSDEDGDGAKSLEPPMTPISLKTPGPMDTFPILGSPTTKESIRKMIQFPHFTHPSITRATILQAAWAMVISKHQNTKDVLFSLASNALDRDASAYGIKGLPAPITLTIPMQIRLNEQLPISTFLLQVKQNASKPATHKYLNHRKPSKKNPRIDEKDQLASLLVIPPTRHKNTDQEDTPLAAEQYTQVEDRLLDCCDRYDVALQATTLNNHVDLILAFNMGSISQDSAIALIESYDATVHQLVKRLQAAHWLYRVSWK